MTTITGIKHWAFFNGNNWVVMRRESKNFRDTAIVRGYNDGQAQSAVARLDREHAETESRLAEKMKDLLSN